MGVRTVLLAFCVLAVADAQAAPSKPAPAKPAQAPSTPAPSGSAKTAPAAAKTQPAKHEAAAKTEAPAKHTDPSVSDAVYATLTGFRPLTVDLYLPPKAAAKAPKPYPVPTLVFVHGGNWNSGDARHGTGSDDFPGVLAALAAKGYVVASVNYRLSGEAHFPAALQDVKAAIRWLRAHANDYNIDSTRIAVWGEEAGGEIAGLVGTSCGVAVLEPNDGVTNNMPSDCVEAVIDGHGVSDLPSFVQGDAAQPPVGPTPAGAYLGCEPSQCAPGVARSASPLAYIGPNSPPFLIQQDARKTVPLAQSQKLYDALQAAHIQSELVVYTDSDSAAAPIDKLTDFLAQIFPKKPLDKKAPGHTSKPLPY